MKRSTHSIFPRVGRKRRREIPSYWKGSLRLLDSLRLAVTLTARDCKVNGRCFHFAQVKEKKKKKGQKKAKEFFFSNVKTIHYFILFLLITRQQSVFFFLFILLFPLKFGVLKTVAGVYRTVHNWDFSIFAFDISALNGTGRGIIIYQLW